MAENNKNSKVSDDIELDPFDELNDYDDNFTIETEKDFFDELEQSDLDSVPEYDSESGKIIEGSEPISQVKTKDNKIVEEKIDLIETINEVDINNSNKSKPVDLQKTEVQDKKLDLTSQIKLPKSNSVMPKPKKNFNKNNSEKSIKDDTKIIDNVKVDSDGVPLLNQFDTDKIKKSSLLPKITITKISMSKIIMIAIGIIITIIGIVQAMNDVVKISDHVMYGEHESIAMGLIFLGIIIIILAFYKELMKMAGLNNLTSVMDDIDSSNSTKNNDKSNKK